MKKVTKIISIVALIVLASIVTIWILFVGYFSYIYPPMEEYEFLGSEKELIHNLNSLDSSNSFKVDITDTTGIFPDDYNVYFTIIDLDSCTYHLNYSAQNHQNINISLIGVFDLTNNKGGYSNSDDSIIDDLQIKFKKDISKKILHQ